MGLLDRVLAPLYVLARLNSLETRQGATEDRMEKFDAALQRIDTATNDVAEELREIKEQLEKGGLTADQEAQVLARIEAAATKLEGVGKPTDPEVPGEPEPEPPTEG